MMKESNAPNQEETQVNPLKRKQSEPMSADEQPDVANNTDDKINPKRARIQRAYSTEEVVVKIQRMWRSYRINKRISAGTINDSLHTIPLQMRFSTLNVNPQLPSQEYQIDQAKVASYLNDIADSNKREVAGKVIEKHVTYLSTSDLIKRTIQSTKYLNDYFINNPSLADVNILIEKGHSSEWIAGIAARYINIRPKRILSFSREMGLDTVQITYNEQNSASLLLIDDISYSGDQLSNNLFLIAEKHIDNCKPVGNAQYYDVTTFINNHATLSSPKQLNLYVMIIFMSEYAFKSINKFTDDFKKIGINLVMIKPKKLHNIRNCGLSNEELNQFSHICGENYFSENSCSFDHKMLLFSSWKKPDFVSMPRLFSDGCVPDNVKSPGQPFKCHHFIPDVKPPYYR